MFRRFLLTSINLLVSMIALSQVIDLDVRFACKGTNNGSINLFLDGVDSVDTDRFSWEWYSESGDTIAIDKDPVSGLAPGEYTLKLTNLLEDSTQSASIRVNETNTELTVSGAVLQENICGNGAVGVIQGIATGGSGSYTYGLGLGPNSSNPGFTKGYDGSAGVFEELPSNSYNVWVQDANGCKARSEELVIGPDPIVPVYNIIHANCAGEEGRITLSSVLGGSPFAVNQPGGFPYRVRWMNERDSLIGDGVSYMDQLKDGEYRLIITDRNGCSEIILMEVHRGFRLETVDERNISCYGLHDGLIRLEAEAANPGVQEPFSVEVTDTLGNVLTEYSRDNEDSGNITFWDMSPGAYKIAVTDALGCKRSTSVELKQPPKLQVTELVVSDAMCKGEASGTLFVRASGGTGTRKFSIDSGAIYTRDPNFAGLFAGSYNVFVKDDNECIVNAGDAIITEPETGYKVDRIEANDPVCNVESNGSIEIFFDPRTDPYHLDELTDITWTNATGETIQEGSLILKDLEEGRYGVRINDESGCEYFKNIDLESTYELKASFSKRASRYAVDYPIELTDKSLGDSIRIYLWDFGNGLGASEQNTSVTYSKPGIYIIQLTVENGVGCSMTVSDTVDIEEGFFITVPSAFSPNGDLLNDTFRPKFDNLLSMVIQVADPNGRTVYESDELSAAWDGTYHGNKAPAGPYFYEIHYTIGSGNTKTKRGKVFLMR